MICTPSSYYPELVYEVKRDMVTPKLLCLPFVTHTREKLQKVTEKES